MNNQLSSFQKFITSSGFLYLYVFVVIFTVISLIMLPITDPVAATAVLIGFIFFVLNVQRKRILRKAKGL
jgi:hypothetical protein